MHPRGGDLVSGFRRRADPATAAQVAAALAEQTRAELGRARALALLRQEQATAQRETAVAAKAAADRARQDRRRQREERRAARRARHAAGASWFYLVAAAATAVSTNTSWRFFGFKLHITEPPERAAMFAVLELALVACGFAMRANVRRHGTPGPARTLAWVLCGLAAYMAIDLSGPIEGLARVALGPALALVALHLALGIEVRTKAGERAGTWARIGREVRERCLSRIGLADDARDAAARTRDRALARAARLAATPGRVPARHARLARAVRASGATTDPDRRAALVAQIAALQSLTDLRTLTWPSPWRAEFPPSKIPAAAVEPTSAPDPTPELVTEPTATASPVVRRSAQPKRQPSALDRVAKAAARAPQATAAQLARRLELSERTVQRHLRTLATSTSAESVAA
jgi:hypothetical protein